MAPVSNKRARAPVDSSDCKKARVVDPLSEKIDLISKTICESECQLQDSHREMLLLAIPHALTVPTDERHEYQTKVAQMVGTALSDYVVQWEQEVSKSKENIGTSTQKAAETLKHVEESAAKIDNQEEEVKKCQGVVQEDSEAVKAAEESLQCASREVADFDENLQETIAQRDHCSSVYNENFVSLKTGGLDAKEVARLMKEVQAMLKKLSTEPSLLSAIAPAFKKSAAERGPFDTMAIEGAEGVLTKRLGELQEQIDKADVTKAEKLSTETTSQDASKAAKERCTASEDTLKAASQELASLEAKHVELLAACNAASEAANDSEAVVATKEGRLAEVQLALGTFTDLLERQSITPEPAADASSMVGDKLEAICESSPMESVVAA